MRRHRLLRSDERGSALVGSIFGMLFLVALAIGAVETILFVHARNVAASVVHDSARAIIEVGSDAGAASETAREHLAKNLRGILRAGAVSASLRSGPDGVGTAVVTVRGRLVLGAPIPASIPIRLIGRASGQMRVP